MSKLYLMAWVSKPNQRLNQMNVSVKSNKKQTLVFSYQQLLSLTCAIGKKGHSCPRITYQKATLHFMTVSQVALSCNSLSLAAWL